MSNAVAERCRFTGEHLVTFLDLQARHAFYGVGHGSACQLPEKGFTMCPWHRLMEVSSQVSATVIDALLPDGEVMM